MVINYFRLYSFVNVYNRIVNSMKVAKFDYKQRFQVESYIQIIRDHLSTQPVKKAYLFGSYARGEQDETSDIDLMIELDDRVGVYKFVGIQLKLEELLGKKVDLISTEGISRHIQPFIDKDKKLVYER